MSEVELAQKLLNCLEMAKAFGFTISITNDGEYIQVYNKRCLENCTTIGEVQTFLAGYANGNHKCR